MGPLDSIFGATLCGAVASACILGLLSVLSFQYFVIYPKDPTPTKALVGVLWLLQLLNVIVVTKMTYWYLVSSFGNETALASVTWEWSTFIGIEAISATSVQMYYARRVWKLTDGSYLLSGLVALLSVCQLAFGLGTMGVTIEKTLFTELTPWTWISLAWLGCSVACDLVITFVQVLYLMRHSSGTRRTDQILRTIIAYIVSTGLLTSVVAILEISTFAALGFNFVHVFLSYPNGGVYVLSLLANLDIRRKVRNRSETTTTHVIGDDFPVEQSIRFVPGHIDHSFSTASGERSKK